MSVSPELALAAAAAIGDKALHEQTKELLELRRQLAESRKVEVTGMGGFPVYAVGQFEDGSYKDLSEYDLYGDWWAVNMTMCEGEEARPLILHELKNLEVSLGGIVYVTTNEVDGQGVTDFQSPNTSRAVNIPFTSSRSRNYAHLSLDLKEMPEPPWMMLKSAVTYNQEQENYEDWIDIFHMMTDSRQLPQRLPDQKAVILCIAFDATGGVRSTLKRLKKQRESAEYNCNNGRDCDDPMGHS